MIRGVQLRGELIRSLRIGRGWSQLDLAERAGVGERTIRNAECGRVIEGSTASYIAGALEVTLELLVKPHFRPSSPFSLARFELAFRDAWLNGRTAPLQELLAPNCSWRIIGFPRTDSTNIVRTREKLDELFVSFQSNSVWNRTGTWVTNRQDSVILTDSFFIVMTFASSDSSELRIRCNIVGRIEQELCYEVIQILDCDAMEQ